MDSVTVFGTACPECTTEMEWTDCAGKLCTNGIRESGKECWMCDGHGGYFCCPKCGEVRTGERPAQ